MDLVFQNSDRNGGQAVRGGIEAATRLDIKFPAMTGTFQSGAVEAALRKRPGGMRTFVMIGEDAIPRADDDELEAIVLDGSKRIRGKVSEPQREHGYTSCGVFRGRVHKESDTEVR